METPGPRSRMLASSFEKGLFACRWLLAPLYAGLAASLALLVVKFAKAVYALVLTVFSGDSDQVVLGTLGLIDISLLANLLLMVIFAGYENFVSPLDTRDHPDHPSWLTHIGFSEIKLKLIASIVAISAVHVLEDFMVIGMITDRVIAWHAGLLMMFVIAGVLLALMDRISDPH